MTESSTAPLSDVAELDEERRRYERWIAELGARRASTPEHVFRRVLDDYEKRLQDVLGKLAEHGEALRATTEELSERVQALRDERQAREDERVEAQLRHEVGEYDDGQWKEIRQKSEKEIAELTKQLDDSEAELGRLQQVLSLTAPAAPAPSPKAAPQSQPPAPPFAAPRAAEPPSAAPAPAPMAARPASPPSSPQIASPSPLIEHRADAAAALAASDPDSGGWPGDAPFRGSAGRRDTPPNPLGLGDAGGAQIKTLRCQECGTMNYPTEWYCERCGGELAAL